jgi:hypothetical protein
MKQGCCEKSGSKYYLKTMMTVTPSLDSTLSLRTARNNYRETRDSKGAVTDVFS